MISDISDYKKIREEWFNSADDLQKVTIDDKVYGSRNLKLIYRNVDFAYLIEASNILNGTIDNSVMPDYPVLTSAVLPKPPLDNFAMLEGVLKLQVSGTDVIMYSGGEDPDYDAIRNRLNAAMDDFYKQVRDLEDARSLKKERNLKDYQDEAAECRKEIETLNEEVVKIAADHQAEIKSIDDDFDNAMKNANDREIQAKKDYAEQTITKEQFNLRMADIIADKHGAYLDRFSSKSIANLEYSELQTSLTKQIADYNKQISDAYEELGRKDAQADKEYEESYNTLHEETYSVNKSALEDSNGGIGAFYKIKFLKDIKPKIDELSVYHAADNLDKENYWIRGTNNTYYMDRLFADWENTKCKKMAVSSKAHNGGCMEHYRATYEGGLHTEFDRWHSGNDVFLDFHWGGDKETATWLVSNTIQDVRVGSRYEVGKIRSLKLVLEITGGGVDGFGSMYAIVNANKSKVIEEAVLKKLDDEDDLNLTNRNDIEDEFASDKAELDNLNLLDMDLMKKKYALKEAEEKDKYDDAAGLINLEYIQRCEPLILQFNTKVEKGEPTADIYLQLTQARNDRMSRLYEELEKYTTALRKLAEDQNKEKDEIRQHYQEELEALQDDYNTKLSEEATRHADERKKITDEYYESYYSRIDEIDKSYEEAIQKSYEERIKKDNALAKQESDLYDSLVQQWKDTHGGEDPPDPWNEEAQKHFKPYVDKVEADEQLYIDYADEDLTERARLLKEWDDAKADVYQMNENARELWTYDASGFAGFHNTFKNSDSTYGDGWRYVTVQNVIAAFAEIDYGFHTGNTYIDYKEKDSK